MICDSLDDEGRRLALEYRKIFEASGLPEDQRFISACNRAMGYGDDVAGMYYADRDALEIARREVERRAVKPPAAEPLAPPPPRYVVGTVAAAPDGALVAVFNRPGLASICADLNSGSPLVPPSLYEWCPVDDARANHGTAPCIIDTAASQGGEG